MNLSDLMQMLWRLNSLQDSGKFDNVGFSEIEKHTEQRTLFTVYLKEKIGYDPFQRLTEKENEQLYAFLTFHLEEVDPRRKMVVERKGLCLLTGWLYGLLQEQFDGRQPVRLSDFGTEGDE